MDRKKFIAVVISAALGLSGAPVYASESAAFSDGEVQEYGAEEEKQEFQTDSQDPETDSFQDKMESDADTDGFLDEATGVFSGEADANGYHNSLIGKIYFLNHAFINFAFFHITSIKIAPV